MESLKVLKIQILLLLHIQNNKTTAKFWISLLSEKGHRCDLIKKIIDLNFFSSGRQKVIFVNKIPFLKLKQFAQKVGGYNPPKHSWATKKFSNSVSFIEPVVLVYLWLTRKSQKKIRLCCDILGPTFKIVCTEITQLQNEKVLCTGFLWTIIE